jgi:plasmid stabilization system protein ParE
MIRFILSPRADDDLLLISEYLRRLPCAPGLRVGRTIQKSLETLAKQPLLGRIRAEYSILAQEEIRSFVAFDYVIFYAAQRKPIVFLGIIHGKRDVDTILRERLS